MHGAAGGGEVTGRYAEARTTLYAPITGLGVEVCLTFFLAFDVLFYRNLGGRNTLLQIHYISIRSLSK